MVREDIKGRHLYDSSNSEDDELKHYLKESSLLVSLGLKRKELGLNQ